MTNEERRADDLRLTVLRESGAEGPFVPWRQLSAEGQALWRAKARAQSVNGTAVATAPKRSGFTPASDSQRDRIVGQPCVVLDEDSPCVGPIDAAHLIDRALGGDDDPRIVVPLCRHHHNLYDNQELSILEYLEPRYRDALAYAVELVGLIATLQQVTGVRWAPETTSVRGQENPSNG